jgi:phage tail-like protein
MPHDDPHTRFNFVVDLGDGAGDLPAGGFRKVRGLGTRIEPVEYRNGNDPELHTRKLPGLRHYDNVVLKRGVSGDLRLWQWISAEPPDRRTVTITMLDRQRNPVLRFILHNAWPCKWTAPLLNAKGNEVAIETIELCHERLVVEAP